MDYEKLYKEALERARDIYTYYCDDREQLRKIESIFPELAENEDEKIRKALITYFQRFPYPYGGIKSTGTNAKEALAWLEKQVKKPQGKSALEAINELKKIEFNPDDIIEESYQQQADDLIDMVTEKPTWSEDDEQILLGIIDELEANKSEAPEYDYKTYDKFIDWLESLKCRVHLSKWKPSDEQMKALEHFVRSIGESGFISPYDANLKLVRSLLNDLKKLNKE